MSNNLRELVFNAKDGDAEAKLNLIEKYKPLVNKYSYKYNLKDVDKEDLKQEGNIAILKAIDRFNSSNEKFSFDSYAINSIRNAYCDLARKYIKNNNEVSLNRETEDGIEIVELIEGKENIEQIVLDRISNKALENGLKRLSKENLNLIKEIYFKEKPNIKKYCEENGLVYSRTRNALKKTLEELKVYLKE